jgi:hypothetical protein
VVLQGFRAEQLASRSKACAASITPPPLTDQQKATIAALDALWDRGHDELAAPSSRGSDARVPGGDRFVRRSGRQAVFDAVAQVVSEARAAGR